MLQRYALGKEGAVVVSGQRKTRDALLILMEMEGPLRPGLRRQSTRDHPDKTIRNMNQ